MKKLYVSDLDGTLLSHHSKLSDYTKDKLHEILNSGVLFTIASARSLITIKEILRDIPFQLPVITLNGATLVDYASEREMTNVYLPLDKLGFIIAFLREHKVNFIFNSKHETHNTNKCWMPAVRNEATEFFYQQRLAQGDPRLVLFKDITEIDFSLEKVISFTVIEKAERCRLIYQRLLLEAGEKLCIYPMGVDGLWQWMTIQDEQANKGNGLKKVAALLGIDLANTVVFGDNVNDIPMFELAGKSCATANAHEEVKNKAHEKIPHHFHDSVMKYVLSSEGMLS